jgi:predicted Zn-dependent protease
MIATNAAADWSRQGKDILAEGGDARQAEYAFRNALRLQPRATDVVVALSRLLRETGRAEEALRLTAPLLDERPVDYGVLVAHAELLKALERNEEAIAAFRRAYDENPKSGYAAYNLAAALGDASVHRAAEGYAREALTNGLDAPEVWLVLARALQGQGALETSESAFYEAVSRNPRLADAQRDLAQLIWMRTGDMKAALTALDTALKFGGPDPRLLEIRAVAQKFCGDLFGAYATISDAARRFPSDFAVQTTASHLAILNGRVRSGLDHAAAAVKAAPTSFWARLGLCEALLAVGDAERASRVAADLRQTAPLDQNVIAYQAAAWRLLGDARYREIYDYEALVSVQPLDTPKGWSSLDGYLADLAETLDQAHVYKANPFQQSVRGGGQIDLTGSQDPVIRAFFEAVAGPIERRLKALGGGEDLVRRRNTGPCRFEGVWSVSLRQGGGRHVSHVHHKGWLSSACHIALPQGVAASTNREGWLGFGQPGVATNPLLDAEHFVEPKAGHLVLFPSYMWHGTEPFSGSGRRLSVAFDLLPA